MHSSQQILEWMDEVAGTVTVLTRAPTTKTIKRLAPSARAEWATYGPAMTPTQEHTYLAKGTATARTMYLYAIGLPQRFAALSPMDRAAVRRHCPYPGMCADALDFLWGAPYYTVKQTGQDELWYYLGVSWHGEAGDTPARHHAMEVEVYLVEGHVITWGEVVPRWSASLEEPLAW